MSTCFVIQPFDKGAFDKRYDEIFAPAIAAADLEAYRVDRDPGASIPIEQIESGIRASEICLAEITQDNPNVWFELGFAIASQKEVVLVCGQVRTKFPFDIQHRNIITYSTDAPGDFAQLKKRITDRIKALMAKEARLEDIASRSPIADVEGLTQQEIVALVALAENTDNPENAESVQAFTVKQDIQRAGYTKVAAMLALGSLARKGMIAVDSGYDQYREEKWATYRLLDKGVSWLISNQDRLVLRVADPEPESRDDIPF